MSAENWYDRVDKITTRITQILVCLLFTAMVVLVFAQVYNRFITNNSLTWSEELSRFLMIWMVFLASTLTFKQGGHIVVNNLVDILPSPIKRVVQTLAYILMLVFVVIIIWGAFTVLPTSAMQKSPANSIVMSYVYAAIPISMVLILPDIIKNILKTLFPKGDKTS